MDDQYRARILWMRQNLLPHEREIRSWLRRNRVNDTEADDIVQEMYARIGAIADLHSINSPRQYAYQVAKGILLNLLRRRQIVCITADGNLDGLGIACDDASPEERLAYKDELARVIDAIAILPERTRDVLLLRRVAGLSQRETADKLAVSEKTVERHLSSAVLALMNQFGRGSIRARETSAPAPAGVCENDNDR